MSRPYFNINSMTYLGGTLSVNLTYYKLRDNNKGIFATISIDGFSSSQVLTLKSYNDTPDPWQNTNTATFEVNTKGVAALGLPSLPGYSFSDPTPVVYSITGTPSNLSVATISIAGTYINTHNSTNANLSTFLTGIASKFNGSASQYFPAGTWNMTVATISATQGSLTITTTNTGNLYNGNVISINGLAPGPGGATIQASVTPTGGTLSGGLTTYKLQLNYLPLGPVNGGNESYTFTA